MSSTYVEVREAENGVGELGFQLNDCETNGLDIQSHYNTFPAKDHTYNKDPSFDEEFLAKKPQPSEVKNNENESPKRIVRAHRNIKHKIIKPRHEEPVLKPEPETEEITKSPSKTISVQEPETEQAASESTFFQDETKAVVKNEENSETQEPVISKKSGRKRKVEVDNSQFVEIKIVTPIKSLKKRKSQVSVTKEEKTASAETSKETSKDKGDSTKKSKSNVKNAKIVKTPEVKSTKKPANVTPKEKSKNTKNEEGVESQGLPSGWTRKVVERKSGKTAGLCDVYIYSPEGIKFRSRPDVAAYLLKTKSKLRIEEFSFKRANFPTLSTPVEKKIPKVVEKEPKKEKTSGGSSKKKGAKLKVKIATPKKLFNRLSTNKETPKSAGETQVVGSESKRTGANRKRKNT